MDRETYAMNKLKKIPPNSPKKSWLGTPDPTGMSKTMLLATQEHSHWLKPSSAKVTGQAQQAALAIRTSGTLSRTQLSPNEQYWAARALTAEALLSAKECHYRELRNLTSEEDAKRTVRLDHIFSRSNYLTWLWASVRSR